MDALPFDLSPLRELIEHHVPAEWMVSPVIAAALFILGGFALAMWGARMVRGLLILAFVGGGLWGGYVVSQHLSVNAIACTIGGAAVLGLLGALLYRLWIGVAWSVLLSAIALTMLGYREVLPQWSAFQDQQLAVTLSPGDPYQPPSPEQQAAYNDPEPTVVLAKFGDYLAEQQPTLRRNALLLSGAVGVAGLLMGLIAATLTTILGTSLLGVLFIGTGVTYFLNRFSPETLQPLIDRPAAAFAGVVGVVLLSMLVQWLQMRKSKVPSGDGKAVPTVAV
jgi:hypothetical protein